MHAQQAVQINHIFGKGRAAGNHAAAENPARILIGLLCINRAREEEVKDLFKIRAVNRHLDSDYTAR